MRSGRGRRPGRALLALVPFAMPGCGSDGDPGELEPRDSRYRALFENAQQAPPTGSMRLRFEPREGWHIEPEAPAKLELEATPGLALAKPVLMGSDALEHSERALVFALAAQRADAEGVDATLRGHVRFGVCRDDAQGCEIVRRDLELPLGAASR